jgi:hypothetical protein
MEDLGRLRAEHPSWRFGTVWASAASGPDQRRLWATREGVTVTAWNAAELRSQIAYEEQQEDQGGP